MSLDSMYRSVVETVAANPAVAVLVSIGLACVYWAKPLGIWFKSIWRTNDKRIDDTLTDARQRVAQADARTEKILADAIRRAEVAEASLAAVNDKYISTIQVIQPLAIKSSEALTNVNTILMRLEPLLGSLPNLQNSIDLLAEKLQRSH